MIYVCECELMEMQRKQCLSNRELQSGKRHHRSNYYKPMLIIKDDLWWCCWLMIRLKSNGCWSFWQNKLLVFLWCRVLILVWSIWMVVYLWRMKDSVMVIKPKVWSVRDRMSVVDMEEEKDKRDLGKFYHPPTKQSWGNDGFGDLFRSWGKDECGDESGSWGKL